MILVSAESRSPVKTESHKGTRKPELGVYRVKKENPVTPSYPQNQRTDQRNRTDKKPQGTDAESVSEENEESVGSVSSNQSNERRDESPSSNGK